MARAFRFSGVPQRFFLCRPLCMKLSDTALADLCARSLWAAEQGYEIALASLYLSLLIEEVGSEAPPVGVAVGSTAHLAVLAADAYAIRQGKMEKKKAAKPVKEAAPPVAPPADEAPPAEKTEEAPAEETAVEKTDEPAAEEVAAVEEAPVAEETPAAAKKSAKAKK